MQATGPPVSKAPERLETALITQLTLWTPPATDRDQSAIVTNCDAWGHPRGHPERRPTGRRRSASIMHTKVCTWSRYAPGQGMHLVKVCTWSRLQSVKKSHRLCRSFKDGPSISARRSVTGGTASSARRAVMPLTGRSIEPMWVCRSPTRCRTDSATGFGPTHG